MVSNLYRQPPLAIAIPSEGNRATATASARTGGLNAAFVPAGSNDPSARFGAGGGTSQLAIRTEGETRMSVTRFAPVRPNEGFDPAASNTTRPSLVVMQSQYNDLALKNIIVFAVGMLALCGPAAGADPGLLTYTG